MADDLDKQTRLLAAMAYGESSNADNPDEMSAIASVIVRQRDARGYKDLESFVKSESSFSFVVSDGNLRYRKLLNAPEPAIKTDSGMSAAVAAAENALKGGADKSNGAYFWDGADIKTNYAAHFKVRHGIKFTDPAHNIYGIKEERKLVIKYKVIKSRDLATGKITTVKQEVGRYDYVYESTAAFGGTIFWKFGSGYLSTNHSKAYK